ncbi:MAG: histidinol-phosphate transaminase [Deltaproteobacteria bacterium]|nr:histidinol-phosphate transaminase [Deltaproteobacteria bacterium]
MPSYFRPELKKIRGYELHQPAHAIKLNQNESPYDVPLALKGKILEHLRELPWNRYPLPYLDDLCGRLADKWNHPPKGVVVTNGSNILIQELAILANKNLPLLTVTPAFSLYELVGKMVGRKVVTVPLQDDFSLPLDRFLKTLKRTKPSVVFLANPNAPTGNLFPEEAILAILKKSSSLVVIDEAYFEFSGKTLLPHLRRFPHLVLLRTFSKAYSLAGARLGYTLCHPEVAREIRKVLLPFGVSALSVSIAKTLLDHPEVVQETARTIIQERNQLLREMQRLVGITVYPSSANYLLFRTKNSKRLEQKLLSQGILIRDVSNKTHLKNCLRVTVGSPEENNQFLKTLKASL